MSEHDTPKTPPAGNPLAERFAKANVTNDGHLTPEQAANHMPVVAKEFKAIDTQQKGYVTLEEIRAFRQARLGKRGKGGKAGGGGKGPAPGA